MIFVDLDCDKCRHSYLKDGWKAACAAFPEGIALDISTSNHSPEEECNNGIGFEPFVKPSKMYKVIRKSVQGDIWTITLQADEAEIVSMNAEFAVTDCRRYQFKLLPKTPGSHYAATIQICEKDTSIADEFGFI